MRAWRYLLLVPLFLLGVGEGRCPHPSHPSVLVIGLDGANWAIMDPLIEAGYLPNFARVVKHSARAGLSCEEAMPSTACFCPPVWNSIVTGTDFSAHHIFALDDPSTLRGRKAIWSVLHDYGLTSTGLAIRSTWPPEPTLDLDFTEFGLDAASREIFARWGDVPGLQEGVQDLRTGPPGLFEALGLLPHVGERPGLWSAFARDRVAMEALRRVVQVSRTDFTFITLHGPDKAEHLFWAVIQPVQNAPIDEAALLEIASGYTGPTVGPAPWSFGSITAQYQEADAWFGDFLRDNHYDYIMLVSDHGMGRNPVAGLAGQHGTLNPEAHIGIFALAGPGVRRGDLGVASVFDVAPTLAYLFGVPVGKDLPGRVLDEAFSESWRRRHPVLEVSSWEDPLPSPASH